MPARTASSVAALPYARNLDTSLLVPSTLVSWMQRATMRSVCRRVPARVCRSCERPGWASSRASQAPSGDVADWQMHRCALASRSSALRVLREASWSASPSPAATAAWSSCSPGSSLLGDQDRSLWNREQIAEGIALVKRAMSSPPLGPYAVQAAIAAVHAEAPNAAATDWAQIVGLYDTLMLAVPSAGDR